MAANFRLVPNTAQGNTNKLAPRGLGHAAAKRGFTNAGWANKAQDWPLKLGRARLHCQIFDNAFLDLF